jgi:hypothetical protein
VYPVARSALARATVLVAALVLLAPAAALAAPIRIGTDPYTGTGNGQHATAVEPDSFAFGNTIVAGFQVGRFTEGGGANIGWATSTDAGATWKHGVMPKITVAAGGTHRRATDAAVAYDRRHAIWLVISDALGPAPAVRGENVVVNRSADAIHWLAPVNVATATGSADFDKTWIVCDNTPASPHYGNCYAQWDDYGNSGILKMSTSSDGGQTWGAAKNTADTATGLGGQPVVQPNGNVIVPYSSLDESQIESFRSTDGGASWEASTLVATPGGHHTVGGGMRAGPLPSVEVDAAGKVYAVWEDCRFRGASCPANDIVMSTTLDGLVWTLPQRIPLGAVASLHEAFVPGLAVDATTTGAGARLALAYHYLPSNDCGPNSCGVHVGIARSANGGATWTAPIDLTGAMKPVWMAATGEGYMTGDYISTSFADGTAHPIFALARCPRSGRLNEAIYAANPPFGKGGSNCPPLAARKLTALGIDPFRFHASASGPAIASKGEAAVTYRASAAGTTRFFVARSVTRNGSQAWSRLPGHFDRHDSAGSNRFRYTGHVGGEKLKPGLYRLVAVPSDPDRAKGAKSYARFRIVS